jgi:hypothetical protein
MKSGEFLGQLRYYWVFNKDPVQRNYFAVWAARIHSEGMHTGTHR